LGEAEAYPAAEFQCVLAFRSVQLGLQEKQGGVPHQDQGEINTVQTKNIKAFDIDSQQIDQHQNLEQQEGGDINFLPLLGPEEVSKPQFS
jgi:hypothetical protein